MSATLDWFGCATFRLRTAEGLTVLLDAYLDRVPSAEQSGVGVDEVATAMGPGDRILVGHSHFDHLFGAERIATRTGCTVIGSYESVRVLAACGVPEEQLVAVAGGERVRLDAHTTVRVLPSLHSCVWATDPMPPADEVCVGETGLTWQDRAERLARLFAETLPGLGDEVRTHVAASSQGERGDGGALVYVVEHAEGTLLFQDSAGAWTPLLARERPDVAILATAGRANADGEPVQDSLASWVASEVAALRPRAVVPCHHDDWLPGFSTPIDLDPVRAAVAEASPGTEFLDLPYASGHPVWPPAV